MALTLDLINQTWQQINERGDWGSNAPTAAWAACIQTLLTPLVAELGTKTSLEEIHHWVTNSIPEDFRQPILSRWNPNQSLDSLKQDIVNILVEILVDNSFQGNNYATIGSEVSYDKATLTPWSPIEYMRQETATALGLQGPEGLYVLPVSVTVNGQTFTHLFNFDQTMGLLLFSKTAGVNFHMTMFGVPLSYFNPGEEDLYLRYDDDDDDDDQDEDDEEDNTREADTDFNVQIGARRYFFDNIEFLQGFATGALWMNVDHHLYWSDLRDKKGQVLTF